MTRLRKDSKRTDSSRRWLERQLKDPYVQKAQKEGYRSRAAFKLIELNEKYKFLRPKRRVLDLGAAPGGWTQVAIKLTQSSSEHPSVIALDILAFDPIPGSIMLQADFLEETTLVTLEEMMGGKTDVVLSDMAPPTTGHTPTDHLRIIGMVEEAYLFARTILSPRGDFIAKVFQGGTESDLLKKLKQDFERVHHAKPPSSRKESSELYVVALGFRGSKQENES